MRRTGNLSFIGLLALALSVCAQQPPDKSGLTIEEVTRQAQANDADAQFELGKRYDNGVGVAKADKSQAAFWYRKAAEQGNSQAQSYLAYDYQNGEGVSKDASQAVFWYTKAAEQGDAASANNLGNMYFNGASVKQDYNQAMFWYQKAAEQGDPSGEANLGVCFAKGFGVPVDTERARSWLLKAVSQGNSFAQTEMAKLPPVGNHSSRPTSTEAVLPTASQLTADGETNFSLTVVPLADIPDELLKHIPKDYHGREMYAKCNAIPLPDTAKDIAHACREYSLGLGAARFSDWSTKHYRQKVYESFARPAELRACALGDGLSCKFLAGDLNDEGKHSEALSVGRLKQCQASADCKISASYLEAGIKEPESNPYSAPTGSRALGILTAINSGLDAYAQQTAQPDTSISDTLHEEVAKMNVTSQQIAAQQAERQRHQEQAAASNRQAAPQVNQGASAKSNSIRATPTESRVASQSSTGPITVVHVDPTSRYVIPTNPSGVCPPSGFIPGAFNKVAGDVSVGVPCTPGEAFGGMSNSGSGSGSSNPSDGSLTGLDPTLRKHVVSPGTLQQCVSMDFNGQTSMAGELGWDRYIDNCDVAINLTIIFANSPGPSAFDIEAGGSNGLSRSRSDYDRLGTVHKYACPKGYGAADLNGKYLTSPVAEYICREHGW